METLTEAELKEWEARISNMSHADMAALWRFAPTGHPVFRSDLPLYSQFQKRFTELGGMRSDVSKEIGWNK